MEGYPLDSLQKGCLTKAKSPDYIFPQSLVQKLRELPEIKGTRKEKELSMNGWRKEISRLSKESFRTCTIDEMMRADFSVFSALSHDVRVHFRETDINFRFAHKIRCSLGKWGEGISGSDWNLLVDAYEAICAFEISEPDFEVRIDWTTGYNDMGRAEKTEKIFLDAPLGFLFHYKGKHVLTVGFSVIQGFRLLIHQIQLVNKKGNRFLYRLPMPYIDWVVDVMRRGFPRMDIYLISGESVAKNVFKQYKDAADIRRNEFRRQRHFRYQYKTDEELADFKKKMRKVCEEYRYFWHTAITFRDTIAPRIVALYSQAMLPQGKPIEVRGLTFRPIPRARLRP